MGYRSTVSYIISFENMEDRDAYVNMIRVKKEKRLNEALDECFISTDDATIFFYVPDYKWYEGYPEVQAHTHLYKNAKSMFGDAVDYKFVRVGEEVDDIEEDSTDGDLLENAEIYPVTTIETPYDKDYRDVVKESDDATL